MRCVKKYIAKYVPRYSASELDDKVYENLISQRALLGALAFIAINKCKASVEFRFEAKPYSNNIDLALLFYTQKPNCEDISEELSRIQRLLPAEYGWISDDGLESSLESNPCAWDIVRLTRRIEYVDIPSVSILFSLKSSQEKSHDTYDKKQLTNQSGYLQRFVDVLNVAGYQKDNLYKRLPQNLLNADDIHKIPYCIPVLGAIDNHKPRLNRLLAEMRETKPVIVSLVLHPVDENEMASSRSTSLSWKRFLPLFASEVANVGFSDYRQLRAVYDRYSLPLTHLLHLSIRVASMTDAGATSVANVLAATLGGIQAFQVSQQTKGQSLDKLFLRDIDMVTQPEQSIYADKLRKRVARELEQANIVSSVENDQLDFISRLPHIYTLEEIERIVRLPIADDEGLPGLDTRLVPPFTIPSFNFLPVTNTGTIAAAPDNKFRIGMVVQGGVDTPKATVNRYADKAWHTIDKIDLTKHALIVGSTGSGKTMSTLFLVLELTRLNVPFIVIEPVKTEYYDRLKDKIPNLRRLRLEGSKSGHAADDFLPFDPLRIQRGITVARHVSYLKSCFEAAFPMDSVASLILENGLLEYYTIKDEKCCGLNKFSRGGEDVCRIDGDNIYPSFATFTHYFIEVYLPREFNEKGGQASAQRTQDFKGFFSRRFANLGNGLLGECFSRADKLTKLNRKNYDVFGRYLNTNTVIELDAVPDADQKALLMAFLLTYVFEKRQAEDFEYREKNGKPMPNALQHVMIVEEAHRVLSSAATHGNRGELSGQDSKAKAVSLFVDMLAEIRAYGQGLVIVEQIPTKIVPEAVKNTNLKIMLRLTSRDDRDYLGEAMNFTEPQKRFVTNLKVEKGEGINFVIFEEGVDQPLMLSLPLPKEHKADWLYDEFFS